MNTKLVAAVFVILLAPVALGVVAPTAKASPTPEARIRCHGPATFFAIATWYWTLQGATISGGFVSCSGRENGSPVNPNRPRGATDFHVFINIVDSATGTPARNCTVYRTVTPGSGFRAHEHCGLRDPWAQFILVSPKGSG